MSWYRSLFFKVFVWFWLAILTSIMLALLAREWLDDDYFRAANDNEVMTMLQLMNRLPPIVAQDRKLWHQLRPGWNLVTVPADAIDEFPHDLEEFADQAGDAGEVLYGQNDGWLMIGPVQSDNFLYIAVSRQEWRDGLENDQRWILPLVIFVVVTALCFLLVWSLTRPIHRLQEAVRQMAGGNFDVSLLPGDLNRQDEIGLLINEVVTMADATQRLLRSHQQLLRDVSHELRSPLTRLQIALALARKKDADLLVASEHDRIERAAWQVESLISQILDLARLQQVEHSELILEEDSVREQVQQWLNDAELEISDAGLTLELHEQLGELDVNWDWLLIERAFDNVLRNAIRYSPAGGVLKVLLTREQSVTGDRIVLVVCDQGPGVPDDMLESIFSPFTQVDSARSHNTQGYGLGLALVRRIVELHRGSVSASNQHPGLCVRMSLPLPE